MTDIELVNLALSGDKLAHGKLIKQTKGLLFHIYKNRFKNPIDIDDFTNIVYAKAFKYLHTYHTGYKFSHWLTLLSKQCYADFMHKGKKQVETVALESIVNVFWNQDFDEYLLIEDNILDKNPTPYEAICLKDRAKVVREAVNGLPENLKNLMTLRFYKEYTYEELVAELDLPMGTVKTNIHKAKKLLYNKLVDLQ